jgi:acyl carrier protein
MELVLFLEETFGIRLADNELVPENLDGINRLVALIERKRAA